MIDRNNKVMLCHHPEHVQKIVEKRKGKEEESRNRENVCV